MPDLTNTFPSFVIDTSVGPSVVPGGTAIPFHASSTLFVGGFSHPPSGHNNGIFFHGGEPRHVKFGGT